jgi:hypothetical protein
MLAFWFHFDWRLPSGRQAPFDVVDLAELDDDGRISSLRIIYDTVEVRPFCMPCSTNPSDGVALGPVCAGRAGCGV